MSKKTLFIIILTLLCTLGAGMVLAAESLDDSTAHQLETEMDNTQTQVTITEVETAQAPTGALAIVIAKQIEIAPDSLNMQDTVGYLGIPGSPQTSVWVSFAWALWVGWIFSTVGAFGGVMAGVGHMSVYGLGSYAKSLGDTPLNKMVTDSVRASNQMLVGLSAAISALSYYRLKRIVLPLGITLGLGSILGAFLSGKFTAGKISFSDYQGFFGLFVLVLGCYLLWETSAAGQRSKAKAKAASKAFEDSVKNDTEGAPKSTGVIVSKISLTRCNFTFCGVEFSFNPLLPFVVGFSISTVATFLGVGGGFLLVPFLTSVTQLPMYLAAGTSAIAVLIGMITGITTLMLHGALIDWTLVSTQLIGIAIGSVVGPYTSRFFKEIWLKRIFIALALYIGINYVSRGFFDYRIFG